MKCASFPPAPDDFTWHFAGNALLRPDPALGDNFLAPEVAYCDGKFYLYYRWARG